MSITQKGGSEVANRGLISRLHKFYPAPDMSAAGYCPYSALWYVDVDNGSDVNGGTQPNEALKSLTKAIALATGFGKSHQCIIMEPSTSAYHDDTGEVWPIAGAATLDALTIMSRCTLPGTMRHTVIGATDEGDDDGLFYSLAENTQLVNLTFLSNKTPVYLGTESGHGGGAAVTVGGLLDGCVLDTGTTASQPAVSLSCTNALIRDSKLVANGATSDAFVAYDPFTIKDCTLQFLVDGIHILGGATYNSRIDNNLFECKPDAIAWTGYPVYVAAGSNDVVVSNNLFTADDTETDKTATIVAETVFTGMVPLMANYGLDTIADPSGGAGDKTSTTAVISTVKSITT